MRLIVKGTLTLFLLLLISIPLSAQYVVQGVVTDSLTKEPLPYASVRLKDTTEGTTTGSDGRFYFKTNRSEAILVISVIGYNENSRRIYPARNLSYKVALAPTAYDLSEVVVKPKRERYRKKDNPAVEFVRRMIESRDNYSPNEKDFWQRERYEKTTFALNNFDEEKQKKWLYRKFDFLTEYIDTSAVTGKPILTVSARELLATDYYRKSPRSEKQWVKGRKQAGVDEFLSKQLLIQENRSVEGLIRQLLAIAIAQKVEKTALSNAAHEDNVPDGIFQTLGKTKGDMDWAKIVELETNADLNNALFGNLAYIMHPSLVGKAKTKVKDVSGAGGFIFGNEGIGMLNGYRALRTNNIPKGLQDGKDEFGIVFGNWADYFLGQWGAIDMTVDPYTQATKGMVRLVINSYWNMGMIRPESFTIASMK